MAKATFDFCEKTKTIKISGNEYNENEIENFLKLILRIDKEYKDIILNIVGDFDSKLLFKNLVLNKNSPDIDKRLRMFQLISETMQKSKVIFSSEINGVVQGPAMEIALSCNFIKAEKDTLLKLNETSHGIIPFFGTTQRLTKLIGYKNSLQAFLIDKKITYEQGTKLKLFNDNIDNDIKLEGKRFFWDQIFTNTFIFYNSKIHSIYKNKKPAYNALLSIIFETSVCNSEVALSIEKRWLKWLLKHKLFSYTAKI